MEPQVNQGVTKSMEDEWDQVEPNPRCKSLSWSAPTIKGGAGSVIKKLVEILKVAYAIQVEMQSAQGLS